MHSKKNLSHSHDQGFSLLEVLVGLFLTTFISLGMVSTIDSVSTTLNTLSSEDPPYFRVESFFQRIQQDLNTIYTPLYFTVEKGQGIDEVQTSYKNDDGIYSQSETFPKVSQFSHMIPAFDNPDKETFIFFVNNNRRILKNSKQSNYAWIKYELSPNERQRDDSISDVKPYPNVISRSVLSEDIYASKLDWKSTKKMTVLEGVKSLEFSFWKQNKGAKGIEGRFVKSLSLLNSTKDMPKLIKVRVVWKGDSGEERDFSRVFRVMWPIFDTKKDHKAYLKAKKPKREKSEEESSPNEK